MNAIKFLAGLAIALASFAASADWTIGVLPTANQPYRFAMINIQTPKPAPGPQYFCDKGILAKRSDGETVCHHREWTQNADGTTTETISDVTPRMVQPGAAAVNSGGYNGDALSRYCQPNGCTVVNNQWVRN